ncbi:MAG: hypothetical protein J5682_06350 [Prevotella sp.]|nr:hypothetical protein [Prevotella sp.]
MKKQQMNIRAYTSPSVKVMRMTMKKNIMQDIFSGGDVENGIEIDTTPDNSGQINRSNTNVWDDQL